MYFKFYFYSIILFALVSYSQEKLTISKKFTLGAEQASLVGNWATWQNPSGLAFMEGYESGLIYFHEFNSLGDREHFGTNFAVNFFDKLSLGLGVNTKTAFTKKSTNNFGTDLTGVLGTAVKLGLKNSLGISFLKSYNYLAKTSSPTEFTLGFQSRLTNYLALGASYQPTQNSLFTPPIFDLGLSIRPYREYLTISLDSNFKPRGQNWTDNYYINPLLSLRANFAGISPYINSQFVNITQNFNTPKFNFGIDLNLELFGIGVFSHIDSTNNIYSAGANLRLSNSEWKSVSPRKNYWVYLELNSNLALEQKRKNFTERLFSKKQNPLSVLAMIRRISQDPGISGVALKLSGTNFGDGTAQEWQQALQILRANNKYVIVYLDNPNTLSYYISLEANKIYINSQNSLNINKLQATLIYFADMLKKAGIKAEAQVSGSYKTAPRVLLNNKAQKEEIEVVTNILNNFYQNLVKKTGTARKLDKKLVKEYFDMGEINAQDAQNFGLVDEAIYEDQIEDKISKIAGSIPVYYAYQQRLFKQNSWAPPKKIAVIPIVGTIVPGRVYPTIFPFMNSDVGAKDVIDQINNAAQDPNIIGIIIRINSPGGDAVASHKINRALTQAQKIKPVISSITDMGASGGYLVAAGTQHIIAHPNTITGSIGVFSLNFSGQKLAQKLGINNTEISPIKNPGSTLLRPQTKSEQEQAQKIVNWHYDQFLSAVALGLEQDKKIIKKHADGRVWLGTEAFERKLVHELGGFFQSIDSIRLLTNIPRHEKLLIEIFSPQNSEEFLLGSNLSQIMGAKKLASALKQAAPYVSSYVKIVENYNIGSRPQARLPFYIEHN